MRPGHGLYALIGHQENNGMAANPPWILPVPSHCIFSLATPHESHDPPVHCFSSLLFESLLLSAASAKTTLTYLCFCFRDDDDEEIFFVFFVYVILLLVFLEEEDREEDNEEEEDKVGEEVANIIIINMRVEVVVLMMEERLYEEKTLTYK